MSGLIIYFSGTGHNKKVATEVSNLRGIDIAKIDDKAKRNFFKDSFYALIQKNVPFTLSQELGKEHSHILLVTPVWAGHLPAPVVSFLRKYFENIKSAKFTLISVSGFGEKNKKIIDQIFKIVGKKPESCLFLRDSDIETGKFKEKLETFFKEKEHQG